MNKDEYDIFVGYTVYPNADNIFSAALLSIDEIKNECIFILDTNALLLPYSTGTQSLTEINKVFGSLKAEKRLVIPGQVAREFANNRPEKLKEIFQQLNKKQNSTQAVDIGKYPLLEEIGDYKKALELEIEINEKIILYRKTINTLVRQVKEWSWNDPVSLIYQEIFSKEVILDIPIDKAKIKKDLEYRYLHKIPPGFKDDDKPDGGIGDLIIWLTILEVAKTKKHVIFVSGDEKNDWYHKSEKQGLYPRFELVSEFKAHSDGRTFRILRLSELLALLGAAQMAVREVEIEEKIIFSLESDFKNFGLRAERSIFKWLLQLHSGSLIVANSIGFPDFQITSKGVFEAVEVKTVKEYQRPILIKKLSEAFARAEHEINQKRFSKITYVFVARSADFNFNQIALDLERHAGYLKTEKIAFVFGYLNEQDEFIQVY